MSPKSKHRDAIIQAAITLFRRQGYSGTGINEIVAVSGAPKGSLYYYFPHGKASIAEAAVRVAGQNVAETLNRLSTDHHSAGALVHAYGALLAGWMAQSKFTAGSPITTTLLEATPGDAAVTEAGREAYATWRAAISSRLTMRGVSEVRAESLAGLAVSALEGALVQARVMGAADIILSTAQELQTLLDSAIAASIET